MNRRVLCVDDEPNVLEGLARTLSEEFDIHTATSGEAGLVAMERGRSGPGPFAVVMSDMRMPGMSGASFLSHARKYAPESVRILLTGQADIQSAMAAVNEGAIFRFLAKPCTSANLVDSIASAVEQHRLVTAERELLDGTVRGIVKLLTDVLAVSSPTVFNRATRLKQMVSHLAAKLGLQDVWQFEVAALLSQLGCIALPEDLVARVVAGQPVTADEQTAFEGHPETAARLLEGIPRLGDVAAMIAGHRNARAPAPAGRVPMGAAILRVATVFDDMRGRGSSRDDAIAEMRLYPQTLDRRVIEALDSFRAVGERWSEQSLRVDQLLVGMFCEEDVVSTAGSVLVCKGTELTSVTLERLRRFADGSGVREPLRTRVAH